MKDFIQYVLPVIYGLGLIAVIFTVLGWVAVNFFNEAKTTEDEN
jgi:hypothetical protein